MLLEVLLRIPPSGQASLILGSLFFLWHLWTFTAKHSIWPSQPKELPYHMPHTGHLYSFFFGSVQLMERGLRHTDQTREPFSIQLPGRKLYIITRPEDVTQVFNNKTSTLDHDSTLRETLLAFGVTDEGSRLAWRTPEPGERDSLSLLGPNQPLGDAAARVPPKSLINWIRDSFRRHLMTPQSLYEMADLFRDSLLDSIRMDRIAHYTTRPDGAVSLYPFLRQAMVEASVRSIFGSHLHEVDPDCVAHMLAFNDHAWQIVMRYPRFFGHSSVSKPYDRMMETMRTFVQRPLAENEGANPLIRNVLIGMEAANLDTQSRAAIVLMIFWAATSNEYNALFWLISHLMHDPALLQEVKRETDAAWKDGNLNTKHFKRDCPVLDAIFHEIFRHKNAAGTMRLVSETTVIGGKELQPGNLAYIPFRQLHHNEAVWGPTYQDFDHTRFIDNKSLVRHPSFRPFGGGQTHCTGRTLAKLEVFSAAAILLRRFDMRLAGATAAGNSEKPSFPVLDNETLSLGLNGPLRGSDLFVKMIEKVEGEL
ncbi:cytochrome P450 [Cryphonectria parasitica EP155]|uniref:Cytochrome P450 n=1 Tax=Cryphonectria parasitica (strain ATCC 38755 / EP155) TaxID=660469 RepID=A0A9P4Y300_CRYP1|nr:cytochrome P450 [Cryphonectria parasitica EP155]KAF3765563.1 cytochrome P450 [Cryphonectria parasitica EP155]